MIETLPRSENKRSAGQISKIITECWNWRFGDFSPKDTWQPPLNVYRLSRRISVCMSVAGVVKGTIDVQLRRGLLVIQGVRHAPEPKHEQDETMQIISMEIDHGPFCRQVRLPDQIDLEAVESRYEDGMLWIELPLLDHS